MGKSACPVDPFGSGVHSEDHVAVFCGRPAPVVVCGYHATYFPELVAQAGGEA